MKARTFLIILLTSLVLPGCLVKSLHPFYTDKDLIYKQELTGIWIDADSSVWEIRQHQKMSGIMKPGYPDRAYDITFTDNKGSSKFLAHLFQLGGQLYLDFLPTEISCGNDLVGYHLVGTHSLARVVLAGGMITIRWYNEEWLLSLFNNNRIRISHERVPWNPDQPDPESDQIVLTASTAELQKFIIKYGNDPNAFRQSKTGENSAIMVVLSKVKN
jgi:hypothetical protein